MAQDTLLGFPSHTLPYRCGEFTVLLTIPFLWFCWSCLERSRWQQRAALRPGEGSPLFRRGSRCARAFEQGRVPMLTRESKQERLREKLKIGRLV